MLTDIHIETEAAPYIILSVCYLPHQVSQNYWMINKNIVLPVHPFENPSSEFQAACDSYACLIHVDLDRQS